MELVKLAITLLVYLSIVFTDSGDIVPQHDTDEIEIARFRRIISGEQAVKYKYPFIVSIQAKVNQGLNSLLFGGLDHFCGGTMINSSWILTAAHCMYSHTDDGRTISLLNPKRWHVRMATDRLKPSILERLKGYFNRAFNSIFGYSKPQTFYHVQKIIVHPDYVEGYLENDIALMKLKEPILIHRMPTIDILPLPGHIRDENWPAENQNCTALGWGCACAFCPPQMFMQVLQLPVLSAESCRSIYKAPINLTEEKEFCAGFAGGNSGICPGDSGGPLVCELEGKQMLAGVVSATHAKKPESFPAVFTRVNYFTKWIYDTVNSE